MATPDAKTAVRAWTPDADTIADLARSVLRQPGADVTGWRVETADYDFGSPTTDGLFRILGTARVSNSERRWSVFVKLVRAYRHWPLFEILPAELKAAAGAGDQWRYEADVYRSGLPGALPQGLRLPIVHRIVDLGDDRLAIVLEDVATSPNQWNEGLFAAAARLLGRFAVRATALHSLPRSAFDQPGAVTRSFYTGRLLPAAFPALTADNVWQHPLLAGSTELRRDLDELVRRVPAILNALELLPQLVVHGDASPQNLLIPADGNAEFVMIDWTLGGPAAVGDDLGQLLVGLAHAGQLDIATLPALHDVLVAAYRAGVAEEGLAVDQELVARGMNGGLVVRSAFTALPLERLSEPITDDFAKFVRQRLQLTRYLVDLGLAFPLRRPEDPEI